jgi:hypothetical protein
MHSKITISNRYILNEQKMAYDTKELEKLSLDAIKENKLVFIGDVIAYLPCGKQTFYDHKLDKSDNIKTHLYKNRADMKIKMRKKWYESDNATLQIGLMKLIADDDEAHRLNGTKREVKHENKDKNFTVEIIRNKSNED